MKLFSIPYYIDLEGKEINGVVLKPYHLKLLGIIIVHDRLGNGCFASTELLATETGLTTDTIKHARADLVKAGIIKVEKGKMGYIKSISVEEVVFRSEVDNKASVQSNTSKCSIEHQQVFNRSTASREATPVLNKNINKNINMSSSADADSDVIKEELQLPFDEDVDEVSEANVVNLKKVADEKNKSTRRAAAVASEVAGILGRDRRQVTPAVVKNMKSVLEDYTHEEVIQMAEWCKTQEFWQDKTLLQMIKKDTVAQALMTKKRSKYDW